MSTPATVNPEPAPTTQSEAVHKPHQPGADPQPVTTPVADSPTAPLKGDPTLACPALPEPAPLAQPEIDPQSASPLHSVAPHHHLLPDSTPEEQVPANDVQPVAAPKAFLVAEGSLGGGDCSTTVS